MKTSNAFLLKEIDSIEELIGVDANELFVVKEIDRLTEENQKLREALTGLLGCKGILTSDKDCVIKAKQLLEQAK